MSMQQHKIDHARCLELAAEMLGGPVRALHVDTGLQAVLDQRLRLRKRRGIVSENAVVQFRSDRPGHDLAVGLELYCVAGAARELRVVRVVAPRHWLASEELYEFWAVGEQDYCRLYKFLRHVVRQRQRHAPPLLPVEDQRRLWQNSIGFLRQTQHRLREFGMTPKRGILLLGEPGNGKTMACRWLRGHCNRGGLSWRNVTAEEFDTARREGKAHELFALDCPGIVFFDDVDMAVRDRNGGGNAGEASTFLSGLDGLDVQQGVVYVFTTNATMAQLDPAFLRPGRIDLAIEFRRPTANLRRRFMTEHWHREVVAALDLDAVVAQTDGLSFAELDEIKRLLCSIIWTTGGGTGRAPGVNSGKDAARAITR